MAIVPAMPYKPRHPCARPGCPALVEGRFCEVHTQADARARYRRDPDTDRRYGSAWRHIRAAYIAAHPLCEECEKAGRLTSAREVHHILPLSQGGDHRTENLMALCKPCHSGITLAANNKRRD